MTALAAALAPLLGEEAGAKLIAIAGDLAALDAPMGWAEAEIAAAKLARPGEAAALSRAYPLLGCTHHLMRTVEMTYRGHVAELLRRVAAGTDTRPGTAAEVCIGLSEASLRAPLDDVGTGLYHRMWKLAFPGCPMGDHGDWYERSVGSLIDEAESHARRRLACPSRQLAQAVAA